MATNAAAGAIMTEAAVTKDFATSTYTRGALCGLAAVSIWAGNIVVAGLGLRSSLTPWDISAIRFGVAGLLLAPYLLPKGLAFDRLGWLGLAALVLRRYLRGRFTASLPAPVCLRGRRQPFRGLVERHRPSGSRAGSPDRSRFVSALRERGQHSGSLERSRFCCFMSRHDSDHGHP